MKTPVEVLKRELFEIHQTRKYLIANVETKEVNEEIVKIDLILYDIRKAIKHLESVTKRSISTNHFKDIYFLKKSGATYRELASTYKVSYKTIAKAFQAYERIINNYL